MKKILPIILSAFCSLTMSAQLTVISNNHVEIGTPQKIGVGSFPSAPEKVGAIIPDLEMKTVETDSLACLTILGQGNKNRNAYITFGEGKSVAIGDYYPSASAGAGILHLTGSQGIRYDASSKTVFNYRGPSTSASFYFYCPLVANGVAVSSDSRLKKDIKSMDDEYLKLWDLNSISYKLKSQAPSATDGEALKDKADSDVTDDRTHYGYIAQEVKEIFPDLVIEDEDGYMSVDYIGLIPLLVDAVKNLSAKVESLENGAQEAPAIKKAATGVEGTEAVSNSLSQNRPNPFDATTVIDCAVEEGVQDAFIGIYDLQGKQIIRLDIEQRGKTSVTVDAPALPSGIYIYALIADGKEVATKRMIVSQ